MNLAQALLGEGPDVALEGLGRRWSQGELREAVARAAGALSGPGPVMVPMAGQPEQLIALLGVLWSGRVAMPVDAASPEGELERLAGLAGARPWGRGEGRGGECAWANDGDDALLLCTSGSTGNPKLVRLSHGALRLSLDRMWAAMAPGPRWWGPLPLHHGHGLLMTAMAPLRAGGSTRLTGGFSPLELGRLWERLEGVEHFSAVPALLRLIAERAPPPPMGAALRWVSCASAALPPELRRRAEERLGVPVRVCYGLTETASWCAYGGEGQPEGSVGRAPPGELEVIEGELRSRSPCRMSGYLGNAAATAEVLDEEGRLRTGDLGHIDAEGWIYLQGRIKNIIDHGGHKVYPEEVEEVLCAHPAVAEAAVFGRASDLLGAVPVARVVLRTEVGPEELLAWCAARLGRARVPVEVERVGSLPRGPTGKLLRARLC